MEELRFIKKNKGMGDDDVALAIVGSDIKGNRAVNITFRNNVSDFIVGGKSDYIVVAVSRNRLYFRTSTKEEGYKLSISSKDLERGVTSKRVAIQCSVSKALTNLAEKNIGDYTLKFDSNRGLHYIEVNKSNY